MIPLFLKLADIFAGRIHSGLAWQSNFCADDDYRLKIGSPVKAAYIL
jgi:hypothetical protein